MTDLLELKKIKAVTVKMYQTEAHFKVDFLRFKLTIRSSVFSDSGIVNCY